jgi:hypothetical protein
VHLGFVVAIQEHIDAIKQRFGFLQDFMLPIVALRIILKFGSVMRLLDEGTALTQKGQQFLMVVARHAVSSPFPDFTCCC